MPPDWADLGGDVGQDVGQGAVSVLRGKTRRTGDGTAGDAQDPGERDSVGVGVGVGGFDGSGDQRGERVMDQQRVRSRGTGG